MKSPGLKSIGISPRDERGPILMAIALGLGGGLLLAAPLNQLLEGPPVGSNHQVVNPFSTWTGMGEKEVVILGTDVGGGNTDVMYTVRVDNGITKLTQIPRDTFIDSTRFGPMKANALYAYGGPDAVKQELSKQLGRPVQHHILVNLSVIRRLGDALGGLEVDVPKRMVYTDRTQGLYIDLQPGKQVLRGRDIEGFLRFRHDELGDLGRMERQKLVLAEVFRELAQPATLARLPELLKVAGNDIKTDLSPLELGQLVTAMASTKLSTDQLPGRLFWHNDLSYWMPDANSEYAGIASQEPEP